MSQARKQQCPCSWPWLHKQREAENEICILPVQNDINLLSQFTCHREFNANIKTVILKSVSTRKGLSHDGVNSYNTYSSTDINHRNRDRLYILGLNLAWIICLCSNLSNIMTAPLSHNLKRQNHKWCQAWTSDWHHIRQQGRGGVGGQKSISVCQQPKLVPVVNKARLTPLSHIIPKFSQHFR